MKNYMLIAALATLVGCGGRGCNPMDSSAEKTASGAPAGPTPTATPTPLYSMAFTTGADFASWQDSQGCCQAAPVLNTLYVASPPSSGEFPCTTSGPNRQFVIPLSNTYTTYTAEFKLWGTPLESIIGLSASGKIAGAFRCYQKTPGVYGFAVYNAGAWQDLLVVNGGAINAWRTLKAQFSFPSKLGTYWIDGALLASNVDSTAYGHGPTPGPNFTLFYGAGSSSGTAILDDVIITVTP